MCTLKKERSHLRSENEATWQSSHIEITNRKQADE